MNMKNKKFKKHIDDILVDTLLPGDDSYLRVIKNLKNEIYCNKDYTFKDFPGGAMRTATLKKGNKYKITRTTKITSINKEGFISNEITFIFILAKNNDEEIEFLIEERLIIDSEKAITYGKHLLLEDKIKRI